MYGEQPELGNERALGGVQGERMEATGLSLCNNERRRRPSDARRGRGEQRSEGL